MNSLKLLNNIFALGIFQVLSYILTFATLPYITRVLGAEEYGKVAFAQVVLNYFIWITNWGFYLSAIPKVAVCRNDPKKLKRIFMSTWSSQLVLSAIAVFCLLSMAKLVPFIAKEAKLYFYGIGLVFGNVLCPFWFLTGLERFKAVAVMHLLMKAPAVPLIFLLVKDPYDASKIFMINSTTVIIVGIFFMLWVHAKYCVVGTLPSWRDVFAEIIDSGKLFISSAWVNFYNAFTPFILGIIEGPSSVGLYSIADRARTAVFSIHAPVSNAMFPRMSLMYAINHGDTGKILAVSSIVICSVMFIASALLWFFSEDIVVLLGGEEFRSASSILLWMSPLPFLVGLSTFLSMQVLLPAKKNKAYYAIYWGGGGISVLLVVPLVKLIGAEGAAITTLFTELFIALMILVYLKRNNYFLLRK
jgi:PST family polysaccharide transporter